VASAIDESERGIASRADRERAAPFINVPRRVPKRHEAVKVEAFWRPLDAGILQVRKRAPASAVIRWPPLSPLRKGRYAKWVARVVVASDAAGVGFTASMITVRVEVLPA
jgi:hypothetical protein